MSFDTTLLSFRMRGYNAAPGGGSQFRHNGTYEQLGVAGGRGSASPLHPRRVGAGHARPGARQIAPVRRGSLEKP